jgi:hypothetical protein
MLMRLTSRSRRMSGEPLVSTSKITATTTSVMSGATMTTMMIDVMITVTTAMITATGVVIDKTTPGAAEP